METVEIEKPFKRNPIGMQLGNIKTEIKNFFKNRTHTFISVAELSSHLGKDPVIIKKYIMELDQEGFIKYCEKSSPVLNSIPLK